MNIGINFGTEITSLPPEFALDDWNVSLVRPSTFLPNRKTITIAGRNRMKPRQLKLSATFEDCTQQEAEERARIYRGLLLGKGPFKLWRWSNADRYITVRCTGANDNLHRGHFQGKVVSMSFDLEAADPFWYATSPHTYSRDCDSLYDRWELTNTSGQRMQTASVVFVTESNNTENPSLHNGIGGSRVAYDGILNEGDVLKFDQEEEKVFLNNAEIEQGFNADWLKHGFVIHRGTNILTYQDEGLNESGCQVFVEWVPKWW